MFAAAAPLEALEAIISMCTGDSNGEKIMANDASRAFSSAPARRHVFVELPGEDKVEGENTVVRSITPGLGAAVTIKTSAGTVVQVVVLPTAMQDKVWKYAATTSKKS